MPRKLLIALLVASGAVFPVIGADAAGEPITVAAHGPGWHGEPYGVTISGSDGGDRVIVRSPSPTTMVVSNPGGAMAVQGCQFSDVLVPPDACGCQNVDQKTARCNGPSEMTGGARLLGGDDTIRVLDPVVLSVAGGRGADRLTGNRLDDYLRGDQRSDRLSGRAGKDKLYGNAGRDSAFGGGGNDLLWVLDGDRDEVIDCGAGNDRAYIDRNLDPKPLRCEHVHRRRFE